MLPTLSQLQLFEQHLKMQNRTEDTVKRYRATISEFMRVVGGEKKTYGKVDIEKYQMTLVQHGAKGAYLRYSWYSMKSFFEFMKIPWEFTKRDVPKLDEPRRRWYTFPEMEKILVAAKPFMRDWLALRVMTLSMGRRKTLSLLKRTDYDPEKGTILLPSVKRGRTPLITLDKETNDVMVKYLFARTDIYPALFPSMRSRDRTGHLTLPALNMMLGKYCVTAGVANKGLHAFRRGMVTYYHRQGLDTKQIWSLGDWKSTSQVESYVQLDEGYAAATREALHPFHQKEQSVERRPTEEERQKLRA